MREINIKQLIQQKIDKIQETYTNLKELGQGDDNELSESNQLKIIHIFNKIKQFNSSSLYLTNRNRQTILSLLEIIECLFVITKRFNKSQSELFDKILIRLENDVYDLKRPFFLAPIAFLIVNVRQAYYSNSKVHKIISGLSISTLITVVILIGSIGSRVAVLNKERNQDILNYKFIYNELLKIHKDRTTILSKEDHLIRLNKKLDSLPAKASDNDINNLIKEINEQKNKLQSSYDFNNNAYDNIIGKISEYPTLNQANNYLLDELNILVLNSEELPLLDSFSLNTIFFYIDETTQYEAIKNNLEELGLVLNIVSRKVQSINNSLVFSNNGVTDIITLLLIVAAFGVFGSIFSIITRVQELDNNKYYKSNDKLVPILTGLFRPFIGGLSSIFIFALISSRIIAFPAIENENIFYLYITISFVSGFSERLVSDFIGKTEDKIKS